MKVVITGITGFVGKNLESHLAPSNDIIGLSRTPSGSSFVYEDLFSGQLQYDAIVHLAGKAHDLKKNVLEQEYFDANYEMTKNIFDAFLTSDAKKFIYMSSVKAIKDVVENELTEDDIAEPVTAYGKSKREAEEYILANLPESKDVYILRPCMIHGPGNKGNLNLLYKFLSKGLPYPLAAFSNRRSFLSIDNLCFVIEQLLNRNVPSGVYNVADDEPMSTVEVISLISQSIGKKPVTLKIPKSIIRLIAKIGGYFNLPLDSERLQKLTENYVVSNTKIVKTLGCPLPLTAKDGLTKTFKSFQKPTRA